MLIPYCPFCRGDSVENDDLNLNSLHVDGLEITTDEWWWCPDCDKDFQVKATFKRRECEFVDLED